MTKPVGRPRTVCPPPEEMIKLGEEMIAWVEANDPLHLSEWWSGEMFITSKVWECMEQVQEFVPYYDKALRLIGKKYLDKESRVREGVSQRWQRVYFKDLRKEEDDTLRFKSALDKEVASSIPRDVIDGQKSLMDTLKALQSDKKPFKQ